MKYLVLSIPLLLLNLNIGSVQSESKSQVKKLQICIKKRIDNCTVKSTKGDLLHMHYTVSNLAQNTLITQLFLFCFVECVPFKFYVTLFLG